MFGVSFKAKWSLNIVKNVLGKYGRWWWGRKSIFEDYRSHFCRMVYPWVFDQICCISSQGNVVCTYFREKILLFRASSSFPLWTSLMFSASSPSTCPSSSTDSPPNTPWSTSQKLLRFSEFSGFFESSNSQDTSRVLKPWVTHSETVKGTEN